MKRTKAQELTVQLLELLFIASIIGFSYFIVTHYYQDEIANPLFMRDAIIQREIQMCNANQ